MSDITKKDLRELAEKATRGPWWIDSHGHRMSTEDGMVTVFIADDRMGKATRHPETGNLSHWPNDWDASFIASANPKTIIGLLDEIEALEAENAKLRAELERLPVDGWKLVPIEPTPEMVRAAEEAHMPFGDMDIALRMAILAAPSVPATVPDAITMADVMRAWEYAEDHPHKYLRGTTNWCAAMAHSLNQQRVAAPSAPKANEYRCRKCGEKTPPPEPYKAYVLCDCGYMTSATAAIAAARKGEGE